MDLSEGGRILLELDDGSTALALIEQANDNSLELEFLDAPPESDLTAPVVVGVLLLDAAGLHKWPATAVRTKPGNRATVAVTGSPTVLQRRHHPRYTVNLPATICRLRGSQASRSQPAEIVDLSLGGLKLVAGPIDIGDTVLISVDIREQTVELVGRVLLAYPDSRGQRVAHVAFLAPAGPSEPAQYLDEYINSLIE